jgi:hypothetical protein
VRKDILNYIVVGGLLYGGHYFLSLKFIERGLVQNRDVSQIVLLFLFLISHCLTILLSKRFKVLLGQVFLGFSVFKLVFAGMFIFTIKKLSEDPMSKTFILVFMGCYFVYLTLDVFLVLRNVKQN